MKGHLANRVQLTNDGHGPYFPAVEDAFGADIDFSTLIKFYGRETRNGESRYSPPVRIGTRRRKIIGNSGHNLPSTSFVERQNLTLCMTNRRFTQLSNVFSKKSENHKHMMAIYAMNYNFAGFTWHC